MKLIGILIVIIGFTLKLDTIAVVLSAGVLTGLVAGLDINEILTTLGSTFVAQRAITLFILTLPVIGMCERFGLKERAATLIGKAKSLSAGKLLTVYALVRQIAAALSIRMSGHPQFVRPLVNPMAQGAATNSLGEIEKKDQDKISAAAAAMDNYGNFFGQNLFMASSGVLLIASTLSEQGYAVEGMDVAMASIPVAVILFIMVIVQNHMLDKSLIKKYSKKDK
ncbi:MAG: DUF969 domain-containing protein [Clostridium sp.]|uniref:DUF969 domain-containing protein n=1 Tax=Clostridium culturomicium TaxID=1499683 RepID=UPI00058D0536|nr:DUF969 domain-containing protein [Clostridium culturomicium]MDU4889526.1 DUF969 domain-containing protein [Clostridium sp.]MDU7082830.1 DUF969 domain-containing protein [Clostridium sp.]